MSNNNAYKAAGVDVEAGYESVRLMKDDVKRTFNEYVLTHLGGFGGVMELPEGYKKPVLVSGTDGVGTKLMIAFMMDKHDTIGIDAVAMCVNDILCQGAKPLFFLDYIACGKNYPEKIAQIVSGVAEGDVLVGLPSTGVHSNGFSLVRKLLFKDLKMTVDTKVDDLGGTLGEALLTPTKIYVKAMEDTIVPFGVKGMSHVTGGGFYENIPRMMPEGLCARVSTSGGRGRKGKHRHRAKHCRGGRAGGLTLHRGPLQRLFLSA